MYKKRWTNNPTPKPLKYKWATEEPIKTIKLSKEEMDKYLRSKGKSQQEVQINASPLLNKKIESWV